MNLTQAINTVGGNFRSLVSPDYSRFLIASDGAGWVLDQEGKEILKLAHQMNIKGDFIHRPLPTLKQCVHYTSQFSLAAPEVFKTKHRISVDYFHGKPEQGPEFAEVYNMIKTNHERLSRVRVSYSEMEELLKQTGIDQNKIIRISIGINPEFFTFQTPQSKKTVREELNIPQSAVVVGSFQKDGVGWGEGMEPKHVKGPDVFLKSIEILKKKFPEIYVLLTGPARGFVKQGLEKIGVPYQHFLLKNYEEIGRYYQALDAYIVSSREEGGPKAVLESMISGVPIISTRVGQAIDIVENEVNGYLAPVGDSEALAVATQKSLDLDTLARQKLLKRALETALTHSYAAQFPLWEKFFKGYVL